MKKLLYCALAVVFAACGKNETAPSEPVSQKKVVTRLNMTGFLQRVEAMPSENGRTAAIAAVTRDSALATKVSHIYYQVFNASGLVNTIHQDAGVSPDNFGIIKDSLAPGNYTVVLLASTSILNLRNFSNTLEKAFFDVPLTSTYRASTPDVFYKKMDISVIDDGNGSDKNITLDRIVGRLEVNIKDAPQIDNSPSNSIRVEIFPEDIYFDLNIGAIFRAPADMFAMTLKRTNQYVFDSYVLNDKEFDVKIEYVDPKSGNKQIKEIRKVRCYRNKKTILSGYLFGPQIPNGSGNTFGIGLNDTWDPRNNVIQF